ncbi:peptidoglycan bridge formation glycyltransferase FemA/FemB family protein [uncultured Maribacter sp.]|uniref:peptidoglycan bridge formation glycyltransferase FemA/FemB family protein n=1 Tax=uncultured Maribacter sp. TaxID=431308 RepID=UPI0026191D18|nr:peptidoglycan bridge formation glycyltransferase FemA/FemB family protein [uncultured Maribacter sp.]
MSIEIITYKKEWDALVTQFENSDFYHTFDYHELSKKEDETPIIIKYVENNTLIAIPLLVRKIKDTPYSDATSVYGYAGPLSLNIPHDFDNTNFRKEFHELLALQNIISIFSRLNPFILHQKKILNNLGEICYSGKIIFIDTSQELDVQKAQYKRRYKTYINKSRKLCAVQTAKSKEEIKEFINIYNENMVRVHAKNNYFFTEEYFFDFIKSNSFKTEILLAKCTETNAFIAGAMFVKKNNIVQYHLSGTKNNCLQLNAIKLLIDEMRIASTMQGYDFYNLGGGVNSKNDNLFYFKSGFSETTKDFTLWKYIVNSEIYNELVFKIKQTKANETSLNTNEYFPSYRS